MAPGSTAEGIYKFVCAYDKNTPTYLLPYPENFKEVSLNMLEMVTKLQELIVGVSKFVK